MKSQSQTLFGLHLKVSNCKGSPLDIRCGWALAKILGVDDFDDANPLGIDSVFGWLEEAEALGYRDGLKGDVPLLFVGTPLEIHWKSGANDRSEYEATRGGTEEEWDALPPDVQDPKWDSFHELCARGIGDEHHFYDVLMAKWLVGYVGH
jgi:hypothetical protein